MSSAVFFLLAAIGLAIIGSLLLWGLHRLRATPPPTFSQRMQAIAPPTKQTNHQPPAPPPSPPRK